MIKNNKIIYLSIAFLATIGSVIALNLIFKKDGGKTMLKELNTDVVLSLEDKIEDNSIWCGTMNLVWNDLKNEIAKQDVVFNPQTEIANNLNKETFNVNYLNPQDYYKTFGYPSLSLKETIKKAIKDKFNENSDILDDFEWQPNGKENDELFILYVMLKKAFEYPNKFDTLDNAYFRNTKDVKYFGINKQSDEKLFDQIKVLFFESSQKFAFKVLTKSHDELIFAKGFEGDSFLDIFNKVNTSAKNYTETTLNNNEPVMIPFLNFKIKTEFPEIQEKEFLFRNGRVAVIDKSLQTIQLELNETGGKLKSEAAISIRATAMMPKRSFLLNDKFTMFLIEKDKEIPYLALNVSDITKFQ